MDVIIFFSLFVMSIVMGIIGLWKKIPLMMFIGGAIIAFIAISTETLENGSRIDNIVATPATFNLTSSVNTIPDYSYNVLGTTSTVNIDGGGTNRMNHAEFVSSASSALVGDVIECINVPLLDIGTASVGTITIGTFDSTGNVVKTFGTILASSITFSLQWYEFCLPDGEAYTIQSGDRIGIKYSGDTTGNGISSRSDNSNPFDGTTTFEQRYVASWASTTGNDISMQLYSYENVPDSVQIAGIGGIYNYEDTPLTFDVMPRIMFGIIGSIIMIAGALVWKATED